MICSANQLLGPILGTTEPRGHLAGGRVVFRSYSRQVASRDIIVVGIKEMPSLFRLLIVVGSVTALAFAGLYVLATKYEPEQQLISKPVPGVKIRR